MATPKLNRLAQRFMQQIQDPILIDAGVIQPGQIIRSVAQIEHYLGMAMMKFIESAWQQAQGSGSMLLKAIPDLYHERECIIPAGTQKVDLSSTHADLWDPLDSRKGTATILEIWNSIHLTDALNGSDPFYVGDARRGGLIYQKPYLWIFPATLVDPVVDYDFTLCFIQAPLNPLTGEYLVSGGDYDIPFSDIHFTTLSDIAEKLYKVDDYQEDAG